MHKSTVTLNYGHLSVQDEQLVPQWYVSAIERFYIRTYDASVLLIQSVERFYARLSTVIQSVE